MSTPRSMRTNGSGRLFVFEVSDDLFGVDLPAVREVLPIPSLSRPPGTPSILQGFLNFGGQAIPVLNTKRLLQLNDTPPAAYSHLVVLKRPETPLAMLVDRAIGTELTAPEAFMPVGQGHSFNDCVESDVRIGTQTVHVLSVRRLLLKEEETRISQLKTLEQERLRRLEESAS